ncbi:MAG: hypothetical protein IJG37_06705, partial [Synergistaceae bacterium]|nr:hypothetical protein [Synergistaceae bacterium]
MAADFHSPLGSHELRLTETRGLEGNALRDARYYNAAAVLHAPDRDSLTEGLAALSAPAVKNIGRNLGLLSPKEKGSGGYLGGLLADRLFAHRTTQSGNQPRTYTDCKRQIVIIFD